jgi:flagellar assembly protein FliH
MAVKQLNSNFEVSIDDVIPYEFKPFVMSSGSKEVQDYTFTELNTMTKELRQERKVMLLQESIIAEKNSFVISPIVKQHRGIKDEEIAEREQRIEDEVRRRFLKIKNEAHEEGYKDGLEKGRHEIRAHLMVEVEKKIDVLSKLIQSAQDREQELIKEQKFEVYELLKTLSKWIILRELKDDGKYLERLLEKLILELGARDNLHISVSKNDFDKMPEVLEAIEKRLGALKNARIEVGTTITQGININSENALIMGTLEQQFKNLDKIFDSVGPGNND